MPLTPEFPGNLRLAEIIDHNRHRYRACSRSEKTTISNEIVQMIKNENGRFLKTSYEGDQRGWVEVSDEVAREKVSHGFRTKRQKSKSDWDHESSSDIQM